MIAGGLPLIGFAELLVNGNDFIAFHFNHFHVEKWGKGIGVEVIRIDRELVGLLEIVSKGGGEVLGEFGGALRKGSRAGGEWMKGGANGFG